MSSNIYSEIISRNAQEAYERRPAHEILSHLAIRESYTPTEHEHREQIDIEDLIDETSIDRYWEEGSIAPMPLFRDSVKLAREHPEDYSKVICADPMSLVTPFGRKTRHLLMTYPALSEAEAIIQLDDYLSYAEAALIDSGEDAMALTTRYFHNGLGYLSENDYIRSISTLAHIWVRRLEAQPDLKMNVYLPAMVDGNEKSFHHVTGQVLGLITSANPQLSNRIRATPDSWEKNGTLVIFDDWVISGSSIKECVYDATEKSYKNGLDHRSVEVHSIARDESFEPLFGVSYHSIFELQRDPEEQPDPSLFSTSDTAPYKQTSMLGAHGAVNFGSVWRLNDIQKSLIENGHFVPAPLFLNQEPTDYRRKDIEQLQRYIQAHYSSENEFFTEAIGDNKLAISLFIQRESIIRQLAEGGADSDEEELSLLELARTIESEIKELHKKRNDLLNNLRLYMDREA